MTRHTTPEDALAPLEFVTQLALSLLLVGLLLATGLMAFGGHVGYGPWGEGGRPCLTVPQGLEVGAQRTAPTAENLRPGVRLEAPHEVVLCKDDMGPADKALIGLPILLDLLWTLGFLALTWRAIRRARREGIFTSAVARDTARLGWFVLGGAVLIALVRGVLYGVETSRLLQDFPAWWGMLANMKIGWPTLIGGFGILTVGRILGQAVDMHRDLEGTV